MSAVLGFIFVLSLLAASPQAMAQNGSPTRDINAVLASHDKELLAIPDAFTRFLSDRKRFIVRADEKLTAFLELESAICEFGK